MSWLAGVQNVVGNVISLGVSSPFRYATSTNINDISDEAREYARLSKAVYAAPDDREALLGGWELQNGDTKWAIYTKEHVAVLVFRGTNDGEDVRDDALFFVLDPTLGNVSLDSQLALPKRFKWALQVRDEA